MALEGPQVVYARKEDEPAVVRALRLAREVEELLEQASSESEVARVGGNECTHGAHSTRIVRAIAASLVDELGALVRGIRTSGAA